MKIAKIAAHSAPSWLPGNRRHKERDGKGEKAEHRHRLQDVERRHDHELGLAALRGQCRDDEGEQQRREDRGEHPQRGAQGIFRQVRRVERDRGDIELRQRRAHLARAMGQQHEAGGN